MHSRCNKLHINEFSDKFSKVSRAKALLPMFLLYLSKLFIFLKLKIYNFTSDIVGQWVGRDWSSGNSYLLHTTKAYILKLVCGRLSVLPFLCRHLSFIKASQEDLKGSTTQRVKIAVDSKSFFSSLTMGKSAEFHEQQYSWDFWSTKSNGIQRNASLWISLHSLIIGLKPIYFILD